MVFLRRIASVSLVLLATSACGRASTLSQPGRETNPEPTPPGATRVTFEHVVERARAAARASGAPEPTVLPEALADMDYVQYRAITFRSEAAVWRGRTPFELQLFHPGYRYRQPIRLHLVQDGGVEDLPFDASRFRYAGPAAPIADALTPELGHAGFRIHYPLNREDFAEEMLVFLGASFFRLVGPGQVYGTSARGVAVDIATDRPEEFPAFREFWLVRPEPDAAVLSWHALLEGRSVTGAYRFELHPGAPTVLDVEARIVARRDVAKLGVAPLSSMFLYGENRMPAVDDFRPQVHDSDGLVMLTGAGEWIWRPLNNGPGLQVTSLRDRSPAGFGLAQRARAFDRYLDLEAQYHRRPGVWVEIGDGDWGSGGVELLTIPTESEFNDNVAAYWVSDEPFRAGDERHYRYRLITFGRRLGIQTLAQVDRSRSGWDALPGQRDPPPRSRRRFVVDFSADDLPPIDPTEPVRAVLETSAGETSAPIVQMLPDGAGWRATFVLTPDRDRPADMRLFLELDGRRLTETWSYVWYPARVT
jgi:glucans biosynthesis protein